jgi:hypothetical protein
MYPQYLDDFRNSNLRALVIYEVPALGTSLHKFTISNRHTDP